MRAQSAPIISRIGCRKKPTRKIPICRLAIQVLQEYKRPMHYKEIALILNSKGYEFDVESVHSSISAYYSSTIKRGEKILERTQRGTYEFVDSEPINNAREVYPKEQFLEQRYKRMYNSEPFSRTIFEELTEFTDDVDPFAIDYMGMDWE